MCHVTAVVFVRRPVIASFAFSGADLFEMEDQRQWLDASFKTYYRPLRQPWSVPMPPPPPRPLPSAQPT